MLILMKGSKPSRIHNYLLRMFSKSVIGIIKFFNSKYRMKDKNINDKYSDKKVWGKVTKSKFVLF